MPDATHCTYRLTCSRLPRLKHSRVSLMSCTTCSSAWLNLGEPRNVSLVLATWATDYIDGLTATRYRGPATGRQAQAGLNSRVGRFAGTCQRAVRDAALFEERIQQIHDEWRTRLGGVRANSAADLLLTSIAGAPVLTVRGAATLIGRSYPQANEASQRLVSAGILTQVTASRRNRAFEVPDVIDAFTDLERQLATPEADTRTSQPARPVPPRRPASRLGLHDKP